MAECASPAQCPIPPGWSVVKRQTGFLSQEEMTETKSHACEAGLNEAALWLAGWANTKDKEKSRVTPTSRQAEQTKQVSRGGRPATEVQFSPSRSKLQSLAQLEAERRCRRCNQLSGVGALPENLSPSKPRMCTRAEL